MVAQCAGREGRERVLPGRDADADAGEPDAEAEDSGAW